MPRPRGNEGFPRAFYFAPTRPPPACPDALDPALVFGNPTSADPALGSLAAGRHRILPLKALALPKDERDATLAVRSIAAT